MHGLLALRDGAEADGAGAVVALLPPRQIRGGQSSRLAPDAHNPSVPQAAGKFLPRDTLFRMGPWQAFYDAELLELTRPWAAPDCERFGYEWLSPVASNVTDAGN